MARRAAALALLVWALALPAGAAEWGGIEPGVTTIPQVRERFGPPTRESRPKVEGYDTTQWVFEGAQAPAGLVRMTVDFGLLTDAGYKPAVVRIFTLEPKPNIFGRYTVMQAWGPPDGVRKNPDGSTTAVWQEGLHVAFDREDRNAVLMIFSVPQRLQFAPPPRPPAGTPPAAPAPGAPPPGAPAPRR